MKTILRTIAFVYACFVFTAVFAEEIRDYYAEPGLHPFKGDINQHPKEHIDPFGGTLQLKYTDLVIPGNGGMDIRINRTYTSLQEKLGLRKTTGVGWTMHFGRVIADNASTAQDALSRICQSQGTNLLSTIDNPFLEFPDGGRELLAIEPVNSAFLITKSRWKMECRSGLDGVIVTSPIGTQYTMTKLVYESPNGGVSDTYSYYTTEIRDVHDNWISISYGDSFGFSYINQITTSDNRTVDFAYQATADNYVLLKTITANNQTFTYNYEKVAGSAIPYYHLTEVVRPDNTSWQYSYYPILTGNGEAGSYSLKTVTYPYGGIINYTYKPVFFDPANDQFPTTVVASKVTGGRDIAPGTWTFDYQPAATIGLNNRDITTVTAPNGRYVYEHVGYSGIGAGDIWRIGLLEVSEVYDSSNNLLQRESYFWDKQQISNENYRHGRDAAHTDNATYAPIQVQKYVERDGGDSLLTEYLLYDAYGNPGQIKETGNVAGDTRTTDYIYFIDTSKWIINRVEDETIAGIGAIDRTFFANGDLQSESRYGVLTVYTYHPTGDLHTIKNARNATTFYLDYYRGIPRQEIHPVSDTVRITLNRTVNPTGSIATQTNGRGFTTSFTYDGLNRLKTITYPKAGSAGVAVNYTSSKKVLTRGNYQETMAMDGFGQITSIERRDTLTNATITTTKSYDALGRVVFESYPNSVDGTDFQFDTLGRQTRVTHPDTSFVSFTYLPNNQVRVKNERGIDTLYTYRSYGDPNERSLIRIDSPEAISTRIDRNTLGLIETVWQGETGGSGLERRYVYTPEFFLESIDNPETGLTVMGRDAVGNMISKKVGRSATTTYTYDLQSRLKFTDYTDAATPDVTIAYDANGNVKSISNTSSTRSYDYDENDNLLTETVMLSGNIWSIAYSHNELDHLDNIKYPSLRKIYYNPDALGRASQAAPYIKNVSYYPSGQLQQLDYANGQTTNYALDNRLRVDQITTSNGFNRVVNLDYDYQLNGNVESIHDLLTPEYDINMTYDGVDRLSTVGGIWGAGTILYDKVGNIDTKTIGDYSLTYTYRNNKLYSISGADSYKPGYDHYGNLTSSALYEYTYDEASNLRSATLLAALPVGVSPDTVFKYDGNGMRVQRTNNGNDIWYVYANNGNLMGEYRLDKTKDKEYFYLGSRMIAAVEGEAPPAAEAGVDQTIIRDSAVTLDGSNSSSPYGTITSYSWTQAAGPTVSMTGAGSAVATFTAPTVTQNTILTFELTVTDSRGLTGKDRVDITVTILDSDLDGLDDDWEKLYFASLVQTANGDPDQDGYSNLEEFNLGLDPTVAQPLVAPTNVVTSAGYDSTTITWADVSRATQYNIYWSTAPGVTTQTGTKIANVSSPYTHINLTNDQKYYYIITAENIGAGESEPSVEKLSRVGWRVWPNSTVLDQGYWDQNTWQLSEEPKIVGDNQGNAIAVWVTVDNLTYGAIVARHYTLDSGWGPIERLETITDLGNSFYGRTLQIDMNSSGEAVIAWINNHQHYTKRYTNSAWQPTERIDNGYLSCCESQVEMLENGSVMIAWDKYSRYYNPAGGWRNVSLMPEVINIGEIENGKVIGIWADNAVTPAQIMTSTYDPLSGWSAAVPISTGIDGSQISITTFDSSPSGDAVAGWKIVDENGIFQYFLSYKDNVSGWQATDLVQVSRQPTAVMSMNGRVAAYWYGYNAASEWVLNVTQYDKTRNWHNQTELSSLGGLNDAAIGNDGTIMLVGTEKEGVHFRMASWRFEPDSGWVLSKAVDHPYYAHDAGAGGGGSVNPRVVLDNNGNAVAVWYFVRDPEVPDPKILANNYRRIQQQETIRPVVVAPTDLVVEATGIATPVNLGTAAATDETDGTLIPVPDFKGPFGIGVHQVIWSATNSAGYTATAFQTVTIQDTKPPVLTAPAELTVNSNDPIAVDLGVATATDIFTPVTITNDAPALFSSGTTVVTWTATDPNGNSVTATQSVTVLEATPPVTTGTFTSSTSKGTTYYDVTLSSNEAGTIYFRLTGGANIISGGADTTAWQTYNGVINIKLDKGGTANFDYYSVDTAGNTEATKTEVLQ